MTRRKVRNQALPTVIGLGVVAVGAIVAFAQGDRKPVPVKSSIEVSQTRAAAPAVTVVAAAERRPLTYYTGGVRKDLFNAPLPPEPARPAPEPPKPAAAATPTPPAPPVVVNPFADYTYSGTVSVGGKLMALVENTKTKEGLFLSEGDSFLGGKVGQIGDRTLSVEVAGKTEMLAKRDDYTLTPLDKNAPFLQPQAAQPGQPGQPNPAATNAPGQGGGPGFGRPGGFGGFPGMQNLPENIRQRIQERMNRMTPEQREQARQRFLDRQFEGGNRWGGRGNRDGGERRRERRIDG